MFPRHLPRFSVQTDALKDTLEGTHSPEGLQEPAKRKEVQCESIALDGRAKFRLEFDDIHDAG